eukprot:GSMAST32.ASY1.ANO1.1719.1 assembled CDS
MVNPNLELRSRKTAANKKVEKEKLAADISNVSFSMSNSMCSTFQYITILGPLILPMVLLVQLWSRGTVYFDQDGDFRGRNTKIFCVLFLCTFSYISTVQIIPQIKLMLIRANLWGYDLGRRGTSKEKVKVAESLGIVCGTVYLICVTLMGCAFARSHEELAAYNAALASITFMLFLGFADDVLELRWRYKIILPGFASLPLLCYYFTTGGSTHLPAIIDVIIQPFSYLGFPVKYFSTSNGILVDLGPFYFIVIFFLKYFSYYIYAGLNGLEAGQSYIIACTMYVLFFFFFF